MAVQGSFTFADQFYAEAYFIIRKISLGNSEEEYFETDENDFETLKFRKIIENMAYVFVYADADARNKYVRPIHAFGVEFKYDPETGGNIYKVAYEALKNTETIQQGLWKDV